MKDPIDLVDAIIDALKADSNVTSSVGNLISRGEPKTEQAADDMYVTVDLATDPTLSPVDGKALISIRIIGEVGGSKKSVYDLMHIITDKLVTQDDQTQEGYGFDVYRVAKEGLSPYLPTKKGRGELVRDLYFYFVE